MLFDLKDQEILGVKDISAQQKLNDYINLIKKWNKTRNLVSRQTSDQDLKEHVIDCLAINREIKTKKILDIGTGAGLPGIVIALTNPETKVTLLDSNRKKIAFLTHVKAKLNLKNAELRHTRIEDYDLSEEQLIVCRALSSPNELIKKIKKNINEQTVILMMVSEEQDIFIEGYKTQYINSVAEKILKKKRGFLRISDLKN